MSSSLGTGCNWSDFNRRRLLARIALPFILIGFMVLFSAQHNPHWYISLSLGVLVIFAGVLAILRFQSVVCPECRGIFVSQANLVLDRTALDQIFRSSKCISCGAKHP